MDNIKSKDKPIGFFDSGVGGLSVLVKFKKILPAENILYFGDTVHLPYGSKSKEELVGYARSILNFMQQKQAKAVVIACNTSSAQAYDIVKNEYDFPIYPVIQTCAKGLGVENYNRIGVFATEATVKSLKYTNELLKYNPNIKVREIATKNWVGIVEKTAVDIEENIKDIKQEIAEMLRFKPDKIILGCTHYPYLINEFTKYAPRDLFIDPAEIFVNYIKSDLKQKNLLNKELKNGYEKFYVSSKPADFVENAKIFYKLNKNPELIEF